VIVGDVPPTATRRAGEAEFPAVLSRGRHQDADAGVCLMEFTALLAGEDLSDRPQCVHPLVAAVARVVNDAVSDGVRDGLLSRGPAVLGTNSDDPRISDGITLAAIEAALPVALPIWASRLHRERRRLGRRLAQPVRPVSARRMRSQERTVRFAAASLAVAPTADADAELVRLLDDVITAARGEAPAGSSPHGSLRTGR
jgi:hypothetical protein